VLHHGQRAGLEGIDSRHTHFVRRKRWAKRRKRHEVEEVAVHINGQTATSFLMADCNHYGCNKRGGSTTQCKGQPALPLRMKKVARSEELAGIHRG
jgi:hypothetical protein